MKNFKLEIKKLDFLFDNLLAGLVAIISIMLISAFNLYNQVNNTHLAIWLSVLLFLTIFRLFLWIYYKKIGLKHNNFRLVYFLFFISTSLTALVLGLSAFYIFPQALSNQVVTVFMLVSLTAGATVSLVTRKEILLTYILLILLPHIYIYIYIPEYQFIAIVLIIYVLILSFVSIKSSNNIIENIRLVQDNSTLIQNLEAKIEEAAIANEAKSKFLANVSHELRTPLNAIIGFSGILNRKETNLEHKELSKQVHTSAKSLLMLINDILDLSKIEDSNFTIEPFLFNAYDEIVEFSHQFEGLKTQKNVVLKSVLGSSLKNTFFGDWHRISQIILNLISNAVKFTPSGGEIIFNVDYQDGALVISVKDTGIGMNKETQDRIFKPFEQADGSITRKYGGTGLGLSITQNLVELMQGTIELESKEGEGSRFKITIPIKEKDSNLKETIELESNENFKENSLSGHILVVEDNKTNQMLVKMLIAEFGLTCDIANDGLEALAVYNPDKHSVVLMDENMPNMNGLEAMKAIKEKFKDKCTPIIALTANTMQGDKENFLGLGMDDYISKPIDENELYETVKKFL